MKVHCGERTAAFLTSSGQLFTASAETALPWETLYDDATAGNPASLTAVALDGIFVADMRAGGSFLVVLTSTLFY